MARPIKIGDRVQFQCWQDKAHGWYGGIVEAFFDAWDMKPILARGEPATEIDLDAVFKGGSNIYPARCPSKMMRIKVKTPLWAEGYYHVLLMRDVTPGTKDTDVIQLSPRATGDPYLP